MRELIVDAFAGGGGASMGITMALGRGPDIAINHDAAAISMHARNHPEARHLTENIWQVNPRAYTEGRPVGLLWASPDCKHFSKAKGGRPVSGGIRSLAWVVVRWAAEVRPRVIILENVEEFRTWGPLGPDDRPCPQRSGQTFDLWIAKLRKLGYRVEHRELRACDYGAPTVRKRLFVIARRDGLPIVWPVPTHGAPTDPEVISGRKKPWRTAAEIIDWSIPCPSIFLSREEAKAIGCHRPLAPATMARIARGVKRYVLDAAEPFLVPITHCGDLRTHGIGEPLRTITTAHRGEHALIAPVLSAYYGAGEGDTVRAAAADEPLRTQTTENRHAVVAAFVAQHNAGPRPGAPGREAEGPLSTVTATGSQQAVVAAHLTKFSENSTGSDPSEPMHTVMAGAPRHGIVAAHLSHFYSSNTVGGEGDLGRPARTVTATGEHAGLVAAFLQSYYGTDQDPRISGPLHTATTKDRFGLVTVQICGEPFVLVDIGMRMLTPRELFRAQGFPDTYDIEHGADGRPLTRSAQIRMCGNSVCPPIAAALVAANFEGAAEAREPVRVGAPLFDRVAAGGAA